MFFAVSAIVRFVRPWYAWSNTTTACRPVAWRAILTAFSTGSEPLLNNAERFSWSPGVSRASSSQTATYPSYGVTMKQVWVKASTCSCTAATTRGAALPTLTTAMPAPRSMSELPSTSTSTPPPARSTNTGRVLPTPADTVAARRAASSRERGPGISVTSRRSCGGAWWSVSSSVTAGSLGRRGGIDRPPGPDTAPAEGHIAATGPVTGSRCPVPGPTRSEGRLLAGGADRGGPGIGGAAPPGRDPVVARTAARAEAVTAAGVPAATGSGTGGPVDGRRRVAERGADLVDLQLDDGALLALLRLEGALLQAALCHHP